MIQYSTFGLSQTVCVRWAQIRVQINIFSLWSFEDAILSIHITYNKIFFYLRNAFIVIKISKNDHGKFTSVEAHKIRKLEDFSSENDISETDTTFSHCAMSRFRTSWARHWTADPWFHWFPDRMLVSFEKSIFGTELTKNFQCPWIKPDLYWKMWRSSFGMYCWMWKWYQLHHRLHSRHHHMYKWLVKHTQ